MKYFLTLSLSFLLLASSVFGQSDKPQTIIVPTGSLGEISEVKKKMLEKTLESKLDDYFSIIPKELFEEAQEKAFEELDYEECTEEQCIMMIKEILQVENAFQLVLMAEEGDTQISLTWNDLDQKRVEVDYCEGCKTKQLMISVEDLVLKLVGVKKDVVVKEEPPKKVEPVVVETPKVVPKEVQKPVVVEKSQRGVLFQRYFYGEWKWFKYGNEKTDRKYVGEIRNGVPNGQGTYTWSDGRKYVGEWMGENRWNGTEYDKNGNITRRFVNGVVR